MENTITYDEWRIILMMNLNVKNYKYHNPTKKTLRNLEKTENIMEHVRHAKKKKIKRKLENEIDNNVLKKIKSEKSDDIHN